MQLIIKEINIYFLGIVTFEFLKVSLNIEYSIHKKYMESQQCWVHTSWFSVLQ